MPSFLTRDRHGTGVAWSFISTTYTAGRLSCSTYLLDVDTASSTRPWMVAIYRELFLHRIEYFETEVAAVDLIVRRITAISGGIFKLSRDDLLGRDWK